MGVNGLKIRISNIEILNEFKNSNFSMFKTKIRNDDYSFPFGSFEFWCFGFVSNFELRISNFQF